MLSGRDLCINRNIVECKVICAASIAVSSVVLIETQWNVKSFNDVDIIHLYFVLIETQWNVKRSPAAEPASDPSINRNILECKGQQIITQDAVIFRINRNILECKAAIGGNSSVIHSVLIETYWNVKNNPLYDKIKNRSSINRNILECKARSKCVLMKESKY